MDSMTMVMASSMMSMATILVGKDAEPLDESYDGHRTSVASIVGAIGDNGRYPRRRLEREPMPVRVLDETGRGTLYDIANGIRYADSNGADILASFSGVTQNQPASMRNRFKHLSKKEAFLLRRLEIEGPTTTNPHFPASYGYDGVISVTASKPGSTCSSRDQ